MILGKSKPDYYQPQWDRYFTEDKNYYFETAEKYNRRLALNQSIDVDICIIGAGFTGLSVAYHLRDSKKKIALLERHEIGWGASGRCGGQILPGYTPYAKTLIHKYGAEKAKALWDISVYGLNLVDVICKENKIACDMVKGAMYTSANDCDSAEIRQYAETVQNLYDYPMDFKDARQVESMLGTGAYHSAIYMPDAGHFHPVKYMRGLAKVVDEFVTIYESTPAEAIRRNAHGYTIYTPTGEIRTGAIVLCGDAYMGMLIPELRRKHVLIRNAMIATAPIPGDSKIMPENPCVFEVSGAMNFYRKGADGSFLIGAGDFIRQNRDSSLTQEKIIKALVREMINIFPKLSGVEILYQWGGNISVTNTLMPNVGKLDDHVYYANGYSGHGINAAHGIGKLLAQAVLNTGEEYKIFDVIRNFSYPGNGWWDSHLGYAGVCLYNLQQQFGKAWSETVRRKK